MRIEDYKFGYIIIDGKTYNKDLILLPDRLHTNWWRRSGHELHVEDIHEALAVDPELLIVGTGYNGALRVLPDTQQHLDKANIELVAKKTPEACQLYNTLGKTGRRIVAALHLTC